jgi:membrane fusion protein (multidrug efflux system)
MANTSDPSSGNSSERKPAVEGGVPPGAQDERVEAHGGQPPAAAALHPATSAEVPRPSHPWRKRIILLLLLAGLCFGGYSAIPAIETALNTISTDDAYVNGHVTLVAPRVSGQVSRVLVDDNYRVKRGDLLVQLDNEPYRVQVAIRRAAVGAAEADQAAAEAQMRGLEAVGGSQRWQLQSAMEQVNNQVATLRANVATYQSRKATLALAQANLKRGEELVSSGGISKEELDVRRQAVKVDEAAVEQALQQVYASRVYLGLPPQPASGHDLTEVPQDLEQTFSAVRTALYNLVQTTAQIGLNLVNENVTPRQFLADFRKRDASGDLDRILKELIPNSPAVKQANAKLLQARADLDQALLDLRYCDIVSEIDGVVTRRNVNPGNNVSVGQSLMATRSITEIWIDCNFKETQLADLRIGQRVRCEVDMYGSRREYEGRITGFTMGTGQTLALLPPQNATGNFVKIVQRLPVRVELTNYDPEKAPLFVGLSVVPYVYYKEAPAGPHAGEMLQPLHPLPQGPTVLIAPEASQGVAPLLPKGPSGP